MIMRCRHVWGGGVSKPPAIIAVVVAKRRRAAACRGEKLTLALSLRADAGHADVRLMSRPRLERHGLGLEEMVTSPQAGPSP